MTTARAWAGRLLISLFFSSLYVSGNPLVRLVGRADLLGQLVPAHSIAHLGTQLPHQRLRLHLHRRPQLVEPRANQGAVDLEVVEGMPQLPDVLLQCPVHTP